MSLIKFVKSGPHYGGLSCLFTDSSYSYFRRGSMGRLFGLSFLFNAVVFFVIILSDILLCMREGMGEVVVYALL